MEAVLVFGTCLLIFTAASFGSVDGAAVVSPTALSENKTWDGLAYTDYAPEPDAYATDGDWVDLTADDHVGVDSLDPSSSIDPADPTVPADQSSPAVLADESAPAVLADQSAPAVPADPSVPAVPANPSAPAVPANPSAPAVPANPSAPAVPANPSAPAPAVPADPVDPAVDYELGEDVVDVSDDTSDEVSSKPTDADDDIYDGEVMYMDLIPFYSNTV